MAERLYSGRLDSGCFEPGNSFHSFLLIFNAEFINISNALRLMYHGSVKRAANGYYSSNLLQLILQFKFSSKTATRSSTQLFMKMSANNWLGNH